MLNDFQSMHNVYQNTLDAEMLQKINAQDSASTTRDANNRNRSDFEFGFGSNSNLTPGFSLNPSLKPGKTHDEELRARFEYPAPTPWVHYLVAAVLLCGLCFLVYKGVFNTVRELTIDDVPDDELFEAFEPEVAQMELQKRFERANARRNFTKLIKNDPRGA